MKNPSTK